MKKHAKTLFKYCGYFLATIFILIIIFIVGLLIYFRKEIQRGHKRSVFRNEMDEISRLSHDAWVFWRTVPGSWTMKKVAAEDSMMMYGYFETIEEQSSSPSKEFVEELLYYAGGFCGVDVFGSGFDTSKNLVRPDKYTNLVLQAWTKCGPSTSSAFASKYDDEEKKVGSDEARVAALLSVLPPFCSNEIEEIKRIKSKMLIIENLPKSRIDWENKKVLRNFIRFLNPYNTRLRKKNTKQDEEVEAGKEGKNEGREKENADDDLEKLKETIKKLVSEEVDKLVFRLRDDDIGLSPLRARFEPFIKNVTKCVCLCRSIL